MVEVKGWWGARGGGLGVVGVRVVGSGGGIGVVEF